MPPGTPFNSFLRPHFPTIRIDEFTDIEHGAEGPITHFLSHTHTDHLVGLGSKSFGATIHCSKDAKELLLRHEVYKTRESRDNGERSERCQTYKHLKVHPVILPNGERSNVNTRDLLNPIPLDTPTTIEISPTESVTVTLIDANHCPGAVMFLIEGQDRAVLHTGDFRAESWWLEALKRNQYLQSYIPPTTLTSVSTSSLVYRQLDAIYLDTACAIQLESVPTKENAVKGLISLLQLYPESVHFYFNTWTLGYEDILKEVCKCFGAQIHFDRYKHSMYTNTSDPLLRRIGTKDPSSTRFHACERFNRCDVVRVEEVSEDSDAWATPKHKKRWQHISRTGNRVVYVNPVSSMTPGQWDSYVEETKRKLKADEEVNTLLVPLCRHSTLPELKQFVSVFQPKSVIPNTLMPHLNGLDWAALDCAFAECLGPNPINYGPQYDWCTHVRSATTEDKIGDVSLKNLVGDEAEEIVAKWTSPLLNMNEGRIRDTLQELLGHNQANPKQHTPHRCQRRQQDREVLRDSQDDSSSEIGTDDHQRAANTFFGVSPGAGGCMPTDDADFSFGSSQPDPVELDDVADEKDRRALLTPQTSPHRSYQASAYANQVIGAPGTPTNPPRHFTPLVHLNNKDIPITPMSAGPTALSSKAQGKRPVGPVSAPTSYLNKRARPSELERNETGLSFKVARAGGATPRVDELTLNSPGKVSSQSKKTLTRKEPSARPSTSLSTLPSISVPRHMSSSMKKSLELRNTIALISPGFVLSGGSKEKGKALDRNDTELLQDERLDLARIHSLKEEFQQTLASGERIILPVLHCLESQDSEE